MTDDKITARIRDLLRLSKSDNVNEAGNAAAQAQALMTKHSITEAMVEGVDVDAERVEVGLLHTHDGRNMPTWKRTLSRVMCEVNQCHAYKFGSELRVIGRSADADIVRHLFSYVSQEVDRLADRAAALRRSPGRTWKNNFRIGVVHEVNNRLREVFQSACADMRQDADHNDTMGTGSALVRVDEALATLNRRREDAVHYGRKNLKLRMVHRGSRGNRDGREAGKRAGASIDLNRGRSAALGG